MKTILLILGALTLLGAAGCAWDHDHDRGGAYDRSYRGYGHGEYHPYDRPYDRDHDWH